MKGTVGRARWHKRAIEADSPKHEQWHLKEVDATSVYRNLQSNRLIQVPGGEPRREYELEAEFKRYIEFAKGTKSN